MEKIKIQQLDLLMEEIRELRLHLKDLKIEKFLLLHDRATIVNTDNIQKEILAIDYFKV